MNTFRRLAKQLTLHYSFVQAIYWCSHVCIFSFVTVFLKSRGFNSSEVGIVISIAAVLSILLQSYLGALVDRSEKITAHTVVVSIAVISIAIVALVLILPRHILTAGILYCILLCLLYTIQPFITAMGYTYINHGIDVNFGLARGIGSAACAFMSAGMGYVIAVTSPEVTLPVFIFGFILLIAVTISFHPAFKHIHSGKKLMFHMPGNSERETSVKVTPGGDKKSILQFFRDYKMFCFLLIGIAILKASHQTLNTYLISIIERVGGDSSHLGMAVGIAAVLELPVMAFSNVFLRRVNCGLLLKISAFFFLIKAILTYQASSVGMVYFAQCFQMLSFALFIPAVTYYCNCLMKGSDKVKGQALLNVAMVSVSNVIGNLGGGFILDAFGMNAVFYFCIICTAIGVAIFLVTTNEKTPLQHY
ncbi:MFS transporter [Anaerolentibacter hominis]|uniref:MFS transporter n=1 Tax=Anaerolentibacter hominis TaxID=3079009 RepID=UPI0031B82F6A